MQEFLVGQIDIPGDLQAAIDRINEKADKVSAATEGNFAGLDAQGNLTDSGKNPSSYALAAKSVTHNELLGLIAGNSLTIGTLYKITDYKTVYIQPETNLDSSLTPALDTPVEPLIVLATSTNTLDAKAYSPLFPQDEIWYDVTKNNTARYQWASPNDKGQIFRRITKNKNDFPYDVRNIKFRRWAVGISSVPVWNSSTTYNKNSIVSYNSKIYLSVLASNLNNTPTGNNWIQLYDPTDVNMKDISHTRNGISGANGDGWYFGYPSNDRDGSLPLPILRNGIVWQ